LLQVDENFGALLAIQAQRWREKDQK